MTAHVVPDTSYRGKRTGPRRVLFARRAAVITRGASGIGLAAAQRFASMGMRVRLADLSQGALDHAASEVAGTTITVPTDVSFR